MLQFSIRHAGLDDAEALTALSRQLGYPRKLAETRQNLTTILSNENEAVYVMTCDQTVIAWIHIFHTVRLESGIFCEIGGLVVEEKFRGKGIGRQLIETAKDWCSSRGVATLRLRSNVIRKEAHRFYRQLGFSESKEQKVFEMTLPGKHSES